MSTTIDGVKYSSKDIEGTDMDVSKKFCQKNKVKAAHFIYVDENGNIENCGVWFNAGARDKLMEFIKNR